MREQSARALAALKFLRTQLQESEAKAHREHERAEALTQQLEALQEAMRAQSVRSLACIQDLRAQIDGKKVIGTPAGSSKDLPASLQSQAVLQAYAKRLHVHVESALDLLADKERAAQKQRMEELRQQKLGLQAQMRAAEASGSLGAVRESLAEHERLLQDAQRKRYFPEAEGYLVSSNVDGIFVGVKDFRLCKLDGHCVVSMISNSSTPTILLQWGATRAPTQVSPEMGGNVSAADQEHHSSGGVLSFQAEDMCIHNLKPLGISEWQTTRFKRLFVEVGVQLTVPLQWAEESSSWKLGPNFEVEILSFSKEIVGDVDAPSFVLKMLVRKALEQNVRQIATTHLPAALATYMRSTHEPLLELECQVRVEGIEALLLDKPLDTLSSEQLHDWLGLSPLQLSTLLDAQRRFRLTPFVLGTMRQLLEYRRFHCRSATQPQWRRLLQLWQRTIDLTVASDARGGELEETEEAATAEVDFESAMTKLWQTVGRQPLRWNLSISHAAMHVLLLDRMLATGEDSGRARAALEGRGVKPDGSFPKLQRLLSVVRDNVHGARLTGTGTLTGDISWEFSLFELLDDLNSLSSLAARMKGTPPQADGGRQMVQRPDAVARESESAEVAPGSRHSHTPATAADTSPALFASQTTPQKPPRWDAHHTAWDGELWT